jgi:CDP-4-dehydro-6-deoxyglucose reductase
MVHFGLIMAAIPLVATVQSYTQLTPTVFQISFTTDQAFEFEAGQFVSIVVPGAGPNGRDLRRAYSIASEPSQRPIDLCVKLVEGGPGTNYLNKLRPGDQFKCFAPYGSFTLKPKAGRNVCFIATGTGIAPFRSMAFARAFAEANPPKAWCLLGVREENEVLYADEFEKSQVQWVPTVSRPSAGWSGFKGRVTDYLRAHSEQFDWLNTDFYLCGNGAMIDEIKALLTEKGVGKESLHLEVYYKPPKEAAPQS